MSITLDGKIVKKADSVLMELLHGAQLDRLVVFGLELEMCFFREAIPLVWFSTCQKLRVSSPSSGKKLNHPDLQSNRKDALPELYSLIGEFVSSVAIESSGNIAFDFADGTRLDITDIDEDDEVVWSVTSDTPGPFIAHDWSVILLDSGELLVTAKR